MPLPAATAAKTLVRDDRRSEDFTLGTLSRRNRIAPSTRRRGAKLIGVWALQYRSGAQGSGLGGGHGGGVGSRQTVDTPGQVRRPSAKQGGRHAESGMREPGRVNEGLCSVSISY